MLQGVVIPSFRPPRRVVAAGQNKHMHLGAVAKAVGRARMDDLCSGEQVDGSLGNCAQSVTEVAFRTLVSQYAPDGLTLDKLAPAPR